MKYLLLLVVAGVTLFSCKPDIKGCTDPKADNYDAYATVEDSACVYDGVLIGSGDPGGPGNCREGGGEPEGTGKCRQEGGEPGGPGKCPWSWIGKIK